MSKIYAVAIGGFVVIVAFLALTGIGHVIDAATQHFMLFYAGVLALIALCAAVGLGLVSTDRMILGPGQRVFVQAAHRAASFGAVTFLVIHIVTEILAQRSHVLDAFVPFLSPFKTFYIGLGTIASDLIVLLVITGILRKRFTTNGNAWRWRAIHYTSYVAFVFGVWHGLLGGRPGKPYVDWSYGFVVAFVAVGLAVRILANSLRPKETLSAPPVPESASSASAPMRAASMFAQLGVVRAAAASQTALTARSGPQPMLSAPVGEWNARQTTGPTPALAALPSGPGQYDDGRQPFYEPGYEGPPRYMGAPRNTGPMPTVTTGPLPRAGTGPQPPANSGPMPRVTTGAMPQATTGPAPRTGTGPRPRVTRGQLPRAATGPQPQVNTGPIPRAATGPIPRAATGPMPQAGNPGAPGGGGAAPGRGTGSHRRPATGPMPQAAGGPAPGPATGPVPRAATGPMPRAATGPMPRAATGSMPRAATGPMPRAETGSMPRAGTGPRPVADPGYGAGPGGGPGPRGGSGPMPRAATGPMPRAATGPRPQPGASAPPGGMPNGPQSRGRQWEGDRQGGGQRARGQAPRGAAGWAGPDGGAVDWNYGLPPWDGGSPEPDPSFRYREPGPGMPGYRGPSDPYRGGDNLR